VEILVENNPGERIDAFLAARLAELSRSRIQALIREHYIQINGHPAKPRDASRSTTKRRTFPWKSCLKTMISWS
jgi:23S rRNA-/tRNA-specific pseudouridylate synthase